MRLTGLKSQLAALKLQVPPKPGKPFVVVLAARGPCPAEAPADTGTYLHWYYADLGELAALQERFQSEFEDTRGPDDVPCVFVRLTEAGEIFEEQHRGGPVSDEVAS